MKDKLCEMVGRMVQAIAEKSRDKGVSKEQELARVNAPDPFLSDVGPKLTISAVELVYARKDLTADQLNGLAANRCELSANQR
jgi:hypothetical protein